MKKKDGRTLPHAVREGIRKRAVSRVLAGESPEVFAENLGFHRSPIYDCLKQSYAFVLLSDPGRVTSTSPLAVPAMLSPSPTQRRPHIVPLYQA